MISTEQKQYAKDLLNSEAIKDFFDGLENRYTELWKGSSYLDKEIREDAYRMIRALHELRTDIETIAKSDKIDAYNSRLATNSKIR